MRLVKLVKAYGKEAWVNLSEIVSIEESTSYKTYKTVVTLKGGRTIEATDSPQEILERMGRAFSGGGE